MKVLQLDLTNYYEHAFRDKTPEMERQITILQGRSKGLETERGMQLKELTLVQ